MDAGRLLPGLLILLRGFAIGVAIAFTGLFLLTAFLVALGALTWREAWDMFDRARKQAVSEFAGQIRALPRKLRRKH